MLIPDRPFRFDTPSLEEDGFSLSAALSLAHASDLAYEEDITKLREQLSSQRLSLVERFIDDDSQAILFEAGNRWVLAFRGSQSIRNWITNLKFLQTDLPQFESATPSVHTGFLENLDKIWEQIRKILNTAPEKELVLTGHSLGGALALIAADRLDKNRKARVYTFGQPLVGNGAFCQSISNRYAQTYFRFVNHMDIVCRLPPGYKHCGLRCFVQDDGSFEEPNLERSLESMSEDPDKPLTQEQLETLQEGLKREEASDDRLELFGLESLIKNHFLKGGSGYITRLAELVHHGQPPAFESATATTSKELTLAAQHLALVEILKASEPRDKVERKNRVESWCEELLEWLNTDPALDGTLAGEILQELKKHRFFSEILVLGQEFLVRSSLTKDFKIRLPYAQALIDGGNLAVAIDFLSMMAHDSEKLMSDSPSEESTRTYAETAGLMGRARKQWYVVDPSPIAEKAEKLAESIEWYYYIYSNAPQEYWHGINVVALAARAERDGIEIANDDLDHRTIARDVFQVCVEMEKPGPWEFATMAEASLALGDKEAALEHIRSYVEHPKADAFALAGTLRQFEEIWHLNENDELEAAILKLLRGALIALEGGGFEQNVSDLRIATQKVEKEDAELQRIYGASFKSVRWLSKFQDRARIVGRVWEHDLRGVGSGFLVKDGSVLSPDWQGPVFVTCFHVINATGSGKALRPGDAQITFDVGDSLLPPHRFRVDEVLWESEPDPKWMGSDDKVDTACLRLTDPEKALQMFPDGWTDKVVIDHAHLPSRIGEDRIYVIGHPYGGELSFTFQDNHLADHPTDSRIRYVSSAAPGSSGSPLFDRHLNLIGMHHAGGKFPKFSQPDLMQDCNQGIPITAMVKAISGQKKSSGVKLARSGS